MKTILLPLVLSGTGLVLTSCVYDDPITAEGSCNLYYMNVRALDGNDLPIKNLAVYIYNPAGTLVGYHQPEVAAPINIESYRPLGSITVVAWGNALNNTSHALTSTVVGSSIADNKLMVAPSGETYAGLPLTNAPLDIFQGVQEVRFESTRASISANNDTLRTVHIDRSVSSFIITVDKIGGTFGDPNNDYEIVIHHPHSGMDANGKPIGDKSIYHPSSTYDPATDRLTTPINIALPSGEGTMVIEIYSGGNLVYTATVNSADKLERNKLSNILINLARQGDVTMVVSDWDEIVIFQGF